MTIAEKLRLMARLRGTNAHALAVESRNISKSCMAKWFAGKSTPHLSGVVWLAERLECAVEFLIDDRIDQLPEPALSDDERRTIDYIRENGIPHDYVFHALFQACRAAESNAKIKQPKPRLADQSIVIFEIKRSSPIGEPTIIAGEGRVEPGRAKRRRRKQSV